MFVSVKQLFTIYHFKALNYWFYFMQNFFLKRKTQCKISYLHQLIFKYTCHPPAISIVFPIKRILHSFSMRSILNIKTRLTLYTLSKSHAKVYSIGLSFSSLYWCYSDHKFRWREARARDSYLACIGGKRKGRFWVLCQPT